MFRNLQIWAKFATLLSVLLIGLATLAVIGITRSINVASRSDQTEKLATFDQNLATLIGELRTEDLTTNLFLRRTQPFAGQAMAALRSRQWNASERAAETIRDHSRALTTQGHSALRSALDRTFTDLEQLGDLRDKLADRGVTIAAATQAFAKADGDLATVKYLANPASREQLTGIAGTLRASAHSLIVSYSLAVVIVLALAIGISLPMAGVMVRSLHRLRNASLEVAERGLPGVVAQLQSARSIEDISLPSAAVTVESRDEIGQVAQAFNTVHQVAVRTAVEQGALRRSIGDMFMNMARRSQSLIDRQIKLIDDLERATVDPDILESLFKLDHLATRMRRNAENLLVLSGTEPTRRWGQPVGLVRVVRAAIAEVEDFTRVELLGVENLPLAGRCVGDVVHLLAELIENATSFSPPNTRVRIAGEIAAWGYVLEIEDSGVGMTDAELMAANQRLANPPVIELALDRMLGFFVVGRLAQRHGLKVELRHSWYGGVTALVMLPEHVLAREGAQPLTGQPAAPVEAGMLPPQPVRPAGGTWDAFAPVSDGQRADGQDRRTLGQRRPAPMEDELGPGR